MLVNFIFIVDGTKLQHYECSCCIFCNFGCWSECLLGYFMVKLSLLLCDCLYRLLVLFRHILLVIQLHDLLERTWWLRFIYFFSPVLVSKECCLLWLSFSLFFIAINPRLSLLTTLCKPSSIVGAPSHFEPKKYGMVQSLQNTMNNLRYLKKLLQPSLSF